MSISRESVIRYASILDVARDFSIPLEDISSGNFDYRCKCPSTGHKNGMERTNSCYINASDNNFYCFGCNAGSNVIDFHMLCNDGTFLESISYLRTTIDESKISGAPPDIKRRSNFSILVDISKEIREYIVSNPHDSKWVNLFMIKVDKFILDIDRYDIKKSTSLLYSARKALKNRGESL